MNYSTKATFGLLFVMSASVSFAQIHYQCLDTSNPADRKSVGLVKASHAVVNVNEPIILELEILEPLIKDLTIHSTELTGTKVANSLKNSSFTLSKVNGNFRIEYLAKNKFPENTQAFLLLKITEIDNAKLAIISDTVSQKVVKNAFQTCNLLRVNVPIPINTAPILATSYSLEIKKPNAGQEVSIDVTRYFKSSVKDLDEDVLTYSFKDVSKMPNFSQINSTTFETVFTCPLGALPNNGIYIDELVVADGVNAPVSATLKVQVHSQAAVVWSPHVIDIIEAEGSLIKQDIVGFNSLNDLPVSNVTMAITSISPMPGASLSNGAFTWKVPFNTVEEDLELNIKEVGKFKVQAMLGGTLHEREYKVKILNATDSALAREITGIINQGNNEIEITEKAVKSEILKALLVIQEENRSINNAEIARQVTSTIQAISVASGAGAVVAIGLQGIKTTLRSLSDQSEQRLRTAREALEKALQYHETLKTKEAEFFNLTFEVQKKDFKKTSDKTRLASSINSIKATKDLGGSPYLIPYRGNKARRVLEQHEALLARI